jgi:hypothetical protein
VNQEIVKVLQQEDLILKTKFADFKVDSQIEKLTLADKKIQYSADLSKNGSSKEVVVDADGNVVCSH